MHIVTIEVLRKLDFIMITFGVGSPYVAKVRYKMIPHGQLLALGNCAAVAFTTASINGSVCVVMRIPVSS